ncbi:MAG: hypothetical protein J6S26_00720 [Solobacterium sp.]|nr:hypothetical protein [Solobacterium sp.]
MNTYLNMQIQNMVNALDSFTTGCELAAVQDDGVISKEEAKMLKTLKKATEEYKKTLKSMLR